MAIVAVASGRRAIVAVQPGARPALGARDFIELFLNDVDVPCWPHVLPHVVEV